METWFAQRDADRTVGLRMGALTINRRPSVRSRHISGPLQAGSRPDIIDILDVGQLRYQRPSGIDADNVSPPPKGPPLGTAAALPASKAANSS